MYIIITYILLLHGSCITSFPSPFLPRNSLINTLMAISMHLPASVFTTCQKPKNICSSLSSCPKSRYRSYDGSCRNLKNPSWGAVQSTYDELVPNNYADGIDKWPISSDGEPLPNVRDISLEIFIDKFAFDKIWNLNTMQWGQILAHDMSSLAEIPETDSPTCCSEGQLTPDAETNPLCEPIIIPENDPINVPAGKECLNFVRSLTNRYKGCTEPGEPALPINTVTAFVDNSMVYGNSKSEAASLREGVCGRLLTTKRKGYEWPPQHPNITQVCAVQSTKEPCYLTGDFRANQNPQLTVLQVMLVNDHNQVADILCKMNPHWDDEKIYQEARHISIAKMQNIHYYEYLPELLGRNNMVEKNLIYPGIKTYVNDYNPKVNPAVTKEHGTAAYRHFHTLIRGYIELIRQNRKLAKSIRLSDWFNRPLILEEGNGFDNLARGLSFQPQSASDEYWTVEVTQFLFRGNESTGGDLRALDIQRARDHGLGTYVSLREFCKLSVPETFEDLLEYMSEKNVQALKSLYNKTKDIDLVVGGSLEKHAEGALVGPTFLCILLKQFYKTRVGDPFFFENGINVDTAFTLDQLNSIRKGSTMARFFCDNGININEIQPFAFLQVSDTNKLVSCNQLPFVNLALWKDTTET